jgi:single-strand DNA-binding protein
MPNTNIIIIEGHAGRDAELRYTANGSPVANISVATNYGVEKPHTEWHRVTAWGSMAEELARARKGWIVCAQGRVQTREWEDKAGTKRQTTEIIASMVRVDEGKKGDTREKAEPREARSAPASASAAPAGIEEHTADVKANQAKRLGGIEEMEDDVPF